MRPQLFTIARIGPGTLSTMASPRGRPWLETDMRALAAAGTGVLVSLLTDDEMAELGLTGQPEATLAAGLVFHRLPTRDRQVPDLPSALGLANALRARLKRGASVVIHCRYGIGRSSTLAAMVMVAEGTDPALALELISSARGMPVPGTAVQRDAVLSLAAPPPVQLPRLYHGGTPGLNPGDLLLPPVLTGYQHDRFPDCMLTHPERVYLATEPDIALAYAALRALERQWKYGAVYAAEPLGETEPDPDMPGFCVRCQLGRVTAVLVPAAEPTAAAIAGIFRYISMAGVPEKEQYRGMPDLKARIQRLIVARSPGQLEARPATVIVPARPPAREPDPAVSLL